MVSVGLQNCSFKFECQSTLLYGWLGHSQWSHIISLELPRSINNGYWQTIMGYDKMMKITCNRLASLSIHAGFTQQAMWPSLGLVQIQIIVTSLQLVLVQLQNPVIHMPCSILCSVLTGSHTLHVVICSDHTTVYQRHLWSSVNQYP